MARANQRLRGYDPMYWTRNDGFTISTNKEHLDLDTIYHFLHTESYWAQGIHRELVKEMIKNASICYGVYEGNPQRGEAKQVGFARVITDFVRFSWLSDVFIIPEYRGRGLSKWLMKLIVEDPKLKGSRFMLGTRDAHALYASYGFVSLEKPEQVMMRPGRMELVLEGYGLGNSKTV